MSRLSLRLLGPPHVERDGRSVELENRKAIALLAYLALTDLVEGHSRDALAGLLWPDYDQSRARSYLRYALWALKKALGETWLVVERESVGLARGEHLWLDVAYFQERLAACRKHAHPAGDACPDCLPLLTEAVALYRADFLSGFSLPDSPEFDEWQFFQTENLRRELAGALERLVQGHTAQGEFEPAITYARRWLALDPLHEPAQRQLMHLYARAGQQAAAVRQYRECARLLEAELGVSPEEATIALYEAIKAKRVPPLPVGQTTRETGLPGQAQPSRQDGGRAPTSPPPTAPESTSLPAFLEWLQDEPDPERPRFVGCKRELAQLDTFLDRALAGQGQVIFVIGEAGSGKTALVREFAQRAQASRANLVVATGQCNAQTGLGDPYLPFRQILRLLTGDVDARWARGVVSQAQARRLWALLPRVIQALLEIGPDLINTFIPGPALLSRAAASGDKQAVWLAQLEQIVARRAGNGGPGDLGAHDLLEQYTNVLQALAQQEPVLLVLDDLQWADTASLSLLFHLGRRLEGSRILIGGTYRPDDVALGRPSPFPTGAGQRERHPLEPVVNELKRLYGEIEIDLDRARESQFVEALLDIHPNQLGPAFRAALYRHTAGQPLFTIELLQDMQERGALVQDDKGRWVEGPALDWGRLPARVEAVIEERIGRLEAAVRETLTVASVEGEDFTAQVVARVQAVHERHLLQQLSRELEKRHRLVRKREDIPVGQRLLARYQFAHTLFQQYLYNDLSTGERRLLHGEIAAVLAELYEGKTDEITVHLARHYAEAGDGQKAVDYLLQTGDRARGLYAHQEAIEAYERALLFLKEQGDFERAARTQMKLGLTYHLAFDFRQARQAYEEGFALWQRARETRLTIPSLSAPHALRLNWYDPPTLDPTMAGEGASTQVIFQLFSGLVALSPETDVVPEVARTWDVLDEGQKYVFHLRDDVRWSDGVPVSARDFEYAWRRVLDPATGSPNADLLFDVKGARRFHQGDLSDPDQIGVRALDEVTLVVELEGPTGYFLHLLANNNATYPLPRHIVEAHGEEWTAVKNLVANGPYRLESWQRGQSMILSRNPVYPSHFPGNVQRVEISLQADWTTSLAMYEADELDILGLLPPLEMDRVRQRHAGEYVSGPRLLTRYIGFDINQAPFADVRVRRAFALATDRETLADQIWRGFHFPAAGGFIPPGMPGHSTGIGWPYDPDRARQLIADAGYPNGRGFPAVDALRPPRPELEMLSEHLQTQWQQILGVAIGWKTMEYGKFLERLEREPPPMFLTGWFADYPDPDNFLRVARYEAGWQNETYTRLVEQARRVTDQARRLELYGQADRLLVEEAVILPLFYGRQHMLVKPWVRKFPTSAIKMWFWKEVVIEPH